MKKLLIMLTILSANVYATDNYVSPREQVRDISYALQDSLELSHYAFVMNKIRVRTRLEVGIEIPLIAKFKVKPEIELYFTK